MAAFGPSNSDHKQIRSSDFPSYRARCIFSRLAKKHRLQPCRINAPSEDRLNHRKQPALDNKYPLDPMARRKEVSEVWIKV